jgi:hypothetical protein
MCRRCQNTRHSWGWPFDSSYFLTVQKHNHSWRALDLVRVREFLVVRGINPEDFLFGFHHLCHLLEDRFDLSAMDAAVRHELHDDRSLRFQDQRREGIARDSPYFVTRCRHGCRRVACRAIATERHLFRRHLHHPEPELTCFLALVGDSSLTTDFSLF